MSKFQQKNNLDKYLLQSQKSQNIPQKLPLSPSISKKSSNQKTNKPQGNKNSKPQILKPTSGGFQFLKKKQQQELVFQDYQIIFLGNSINLSSGRIKIFKQKIMENGGFVYDIQEIINICESEISKFLENPKCLIISSDDLPKRLYDKMVELFDLPSSFWDSKLIVDCDWITQSLQQHKIQEDLEKYRVIFKFDKNKEKQEKKERKEKLEKQEQLNILETGAQALKPQSKKIKQQDQNTTQKFKLKMKDIIENKKKEYKDNEYLWNYDYNDTYHLQQDNNSQQQQNTQKSIQLKKEETEQKGSKLIIQNQNQNLALQQLIKQSPFKTFVCKKIKINSNESIKSYEENQNFSQNLIQNDNQQIKLKPTDKLKINKINNNQSEDLDNYSPCSNQNSQIILENKTNDDINLNSKRKFDFDDIQRENIKENEIQQKKIKLEDSEFKSDQIDLIKYLQSQENQSDIDCEIDDDFDENEDDDWLENLNQEKNYIQKNDKKSFDHDQQIQKNQQGNQLKQKLQQKDMIVLSSSKFQKENQYIIDELERLMNYYKSIFDYGRSMAYKKSMQAIRTVDKAIVEPQDVENLPYIGQKLKEKIKEIVKTGKLNKSQSVRNNVRFQAISELTKIHGIGMKKAQQLYENGITSIAHLKENTHLLNKTQILGLEHIEDLQQKIPRKETEQIVKIVQDAIEELSDYSNQYKSVPCGSYRRGVELSGDVDILITLNNNKQFKKGYFLKKLVYYLQNEKKLITHHLSGPEHNSEQTLNSESYMGICKLEGGIHRRLDLKLYNREYFGYALMHFTGSKEFNASIRLFARKNKRILMNDRGFFQINNYVYGQKFDTTQLKIAAPDEQSIFRYLGLEYKTPQERNL